MKLIVGLGNPGEKYKNTRHNAGFWVVDRLALRAQGKKTLLFKPQGFMNRSGAELKKFLKKFEVRNLKDLYVVYDDLDIKLGEYKISFGKGPKDHRGVQNIFEQLGTKDFWQIRIGVDNREETGFKGTGEEYVLANWRPEEKEVIEKVIERVIKELRHVFA